MQSRRAVCGDWSDAFHTHRRAGTAAEWQLLSCELVKQHRHRPHLCLKDEKWAEQNRLAIRCLIKYPGFFFVCLFTGCLNFSFAHPVYVALVLVFLQPAVKGCSDSEFKLSKHNTCLAQSCPLIGWNSLLFRGRGYVCNRFYLILWAFYGQCRAYSHRSLWLSSHDTSC